MPITSFLEDNAARFPDDIALVEINPAALGGAGDWREFSLVETSRSSGYRKEATWREFDEMANRVARLILAQGVRRGGKVAILLMNCLEWLPIYFGVLKSGAIAVPMNFRYTADEIGYCLDLADVELLIFGPEFVERVELLTRGSLAQSDAESPPNICKNERPPLNMWYVGEDACPAFAQPLNELLRDLSAASGAECAAQQSFRSLKETPQEFPPYCGKPPVELSDDQDAAIYFSSGTTGFPKAILHSHASLVSACVTEQAHHGQTRDDIFLCIPPLYHTGAKMHWFGSLISGGRGVLLRGVRPDWILGAAARERASIVWLLVPWAQDILDAIDRGDARLSDYDLSAWRLMHIGAQPVPPSLIKRWREKFPNHAYDTNYGLSESAGPGAVHLGVENMHKVGAIGVAGYGWETRIVDEHGARVPSGGVGELIVRGPGVMRCYYNDPAATAATLKDGWLYTGDMAREDEDGFIYLVDRKKDVIITGGENLYPVQIEDFLRGMGAIKDVAVIGLPDPRLGEIAAAIIEPKEGASITEADVEAFCRALPRYKRPRKILFDKVPRNPTGKIEKPRLRERYRANRLVEEETTR
ncbi:MAG: acyl--CoA ligase [Oscillospiraceae bacterium]|jgi:acyl-CoA synthetase (AMP-forming)/AMP-acid ligase II|nr:acyl--CoA ligase [Oscillospiraceae bacterium]